MIPYVPAEPAEFIPVIDLSDTFGGSRKDRERVCREIHRTCVDTGFFYISGHRIPESAREGVLKLAEQYFSLPETEKGRVKGSGGGFGYDAPKRQTLDEGAPPDLKEGFMFGAMPDGGAYGFTVDWPQEFLDMRRTLTEYRKQIANLGRHLMSLLATSLDVPDDYFEDAVHDPNTSVRLLHYPPLPANAAANELGAGAHTDFGGLTFLLQDNIGGLEVRNAAGEWLQAKPIPGTFVVNLGDMIQRWTNDIYRSTLHRVASNASGRHRYSVPTFYSPNGSHVVECIPTCVANGDTPHYAPCTASEHILERLRQTYKPQPQATAAA